MLMSVMNNHDTLEHFVGKVWLTRPISEKTEQDIAVCVEHDGDFMALACLKLKPDGIYHIKEKPIGRREDESFMRYMDKLTGCQGGSGPDLFDKVCLSYNTNKSLGAVAREFNISKERVRRILITRNKLTSDLISNIAWLYDNGRGKSITEISEVLGVSESVVRKNMAYHNQ